MFLITNLLREIKKKSEILRINVEKSASKSLEISQKKYYTVK